MYVLIGTRQHTFFSLRSRRYSRAQGGKLEIPPVQKLSILSSAHRAHGSAHTNVFALENQSERELLIMLGIVQNMDWTGLDSWTGQLDWTVGLDNWTGQLDWTVGLDYWTGFRMGFFPLNRRNLTDSKGLIPRQRNSSRETVYAKYGWLGMNDSIEFSHLFRFRSE